MKRKNEPPASPAPEISSDAALRAALATFRDHVRWHSQGLAFIEAGDDDWPLVQVAHPIGAFVHAAREGGAEVGLIFVSQNPAHVAGEYLQAMERAIAAFWSRTGLPATARVTGRRGVLCTKDRAVYALRVQLDLTESEQF